LASEIGAAITITPNGVRVLTSLGFSFDRARARCLVVWETMDGITLERLAALDFKHAEARYGFPVISVHRVDMHKELLRLASHD
jgi:salicylate hydroxylase